MNRLEDPRADSYHVQIYFHLERGHNFILAQVPVYKFLM